jgi:hypothetical protein
VPKYQLPTLFFCLFDMKHNPQSDIPAGCTLQEERGSACHG